MRSMIVKLECLSRYSINDHLLCLHAKCRSSFTTARLLLDQMPDRSFKPANTTTSVPLTKIADTPIGSWEFLLFFKKKLLEMVHLSCTIFVRLLGACAKLNDIGVVKQAHSLIVKLGFSSNHFIGSTLVDLYSKHAFVIEARRVFDETPIKDIVLWNVMVSCYALNGLGQEAFVIFKWMQLEGLNGDGFTFSSLLSSCNSLRCSKLGRQTHGIIIRLSFDLDVVVGSALIDMYAKCGDIVDSQKVFDVMNVRNVVSWNCIIVGYGMQGKANEAMKLLREMLGGRAKPDELTLSSVLSCCANSAAAIEAIQVHGYVIKNGFHNFVSIGNALISAYARHGSINHAIRSFHLISNPDLFTWSSMIHSYAIHGLAKKALDAFRTMLDEGVRPDGVAFVGVLSACSHAGLVEEGLHYFASMSKDYQIKPSSEHCACLVDLLGRAGHLGEAYDVLAGMPLELIAADALGAFIGACKVHGNTGFAKWAADQLFSVEADVSANYMLMSNIYAAYGCWDDVARVRKMMKSSCSDKVPGFSWMDLGGRMHTFVSNDRSHPQSEEIHVIMDLLIGEMKEIDSFA